MSTIIAWLSANWSVIAPVLAIVLPLFLKIPFVEHSTIAEIVIALLGKLLPSPVTQPTAPVSSSGETDPEGNNVQSQMTAQRVRDPKK